MNELQRVELPIISGSQKIVGLFIITVLPNIKQYRPFPLIDERNKPDRDVSLEPVQLLEGNEYLYELKLYEEVKRVTTDQPSMIFPDDIRGDRGRLRTGLHIGAVRITFFGSNGELGTVAFEVRSKKIQYVTQYRWMLRDISSIAAELIMQSFAPTMQRFIPENVYDVPTLYQRFAFLKSILMDGTLQSAITYIVRNPHRAWIQSSESRYPGQSIPASSDVARQIARGGPRTTYHLGGKLVSDTLPMQFEVVRTRPTLDTIPNRFVQFALVHWRQSVFEISERLDQSAKTISTTKNDRARREIEMVLKHLDRLLERVDFNELTPLDRFPTNDTVLFQGEGYRDITRLYIQFELAARLFWDGGDSVYEAGKRDIATLYEYWVYLQLIQIIAELANVTVDTSRLFESSHDGMTLKLRKGHQRVVHGTVERLHRKLKIEFWFNRTFHEKGAYGTWNLTMRPDFSLRISPKDGVEYAETWIHFDAKYRLEGLSQLFDSVISESNLNGEEWITENRQSARTSLNSGSTMRDDVLKMHAYRDAIRRTSGAYIIYPGTEKKVIKKYHEILPGIGAFCLQPMAEKIENGKRSIAHFLDDVLNHVASQVTQHERERFWMQKVYGSKESDVAAPLAPFISKPPADTLVLLGYVKDKKHLKWIQQTNLYNLRADHRTGSVGLRGMDLGVELVILYGPELSVPYLKYVVGGPKMMAKDSMIAAEYPNPRGNLYICLQVSPITSLVWQEWLGKLDVEKLRFNEAPHEALGAPVVTTWRRVIEMMN